MVDGVQWETQVRHKAGSLTQKSKVSPSQILHVCVFLGVKPRTLESQASAPPPSHTPAKLSRDMEPQTENATPDLSCDRWPSRGGTLSMFCEIPFGPCVSRVCETEANFKICTYSKIRKTKNPPKQKNPPKSETLLVLGISDKGKPSRTDRVRDQGGYGQFGEQDSSLVASMGDRESHSLQRGASPG
jgi:hypothetical protein